MDTVRYITLTMPHRLNDSTDGPTQLTVFVKHLVYIEPRKDGATIHTTRAGDGIRVLESNKDILTKIAQAIVL